MWSKIERRAARFLHRDVVELRTAPSIVSFTFDDVPRSACKIGSELLQAAGGKATFYVCGGLEDEDGSDFFVRDEDLRGLADAGHEIGSHGYRHLDFQTCSPAEVIADLDLNDAYLTACGLAPARHFAFPYGSVNPRVKQLLKGRFDTLRGVQNAPNTERFDRALLKAVHLYSGTFSAAAINRLMQSAVERPTWLIFLSHGVTDDGGEYDIRPGQLATTIEAARQHGLPMMTMSSAFESFTRGSREPSLLAGSTNRTAAVHQIGLGEGEQRLDDPGNRPVAYQSFGG